LYLYRIHCIYTAYIVSIPHTLYLYRIHCIYSIIFTTLTLNHLSRSASQRVLSAIEYWSRYKAFATVSYIHTVQYTYSEQHHTIGDEKERESTSPEWQVWLLHPSDRVYLHPWVVG